MYRLKRFKWPIVGIVIIAAVAFVYLKRKKPEDGMDVRTAEVVRQDIVVSVAAVGQLEPLTIVDVKANVAGEIVELAVDRGDAVKTGDLIARVDPTETRTTYEQADADVAGANARVLEAEAELSRQKRTTTAQISSARDGISSARARLEQAQSSLEYQKQSTSSDILRSQEALGTSKARLRQAEARAAAQPSLTASAIDKAQAELEVAQQAQKRLLGATQPQERASVEATVKATQISLNNEKKRIERIRQLHARGGAALQELESAQSALADAEDRHETAQAAFETLQTKQAAEAREAELKVKQAQASLSTARANEIDVQIAREELASAQSAVREAEAALKTALAGKAQIAVKEADIRVAKASQSEAQSQLEVARANSLSASKAAHQLTSAEAQTTRSKAQLENAQKNLTYTTITAPREGVVIDRYVEEGTVITSGRSSIAQGTNIVTLADVSRMFVLAEVDEADIGRVKVGLAAEIDIETFPGETMQGKVIQVYPRGETVNNVTVFKVRVEILKPSSKLRPGMTADVSIVLARKRDVLAAPAEAVFEQEGQSFAEVVREEGKEPERVEVTPGLSDFEFIEIVSGLKEGDNVVLDAGGAFGGGPGGGGPGGGRGGRGGPGGGGGGTQRNMQRMMRMGGGGRR